MVLGTSLEGLSSVDVSKYDVPVYYPTIGLTDDEVHSNDQETQALAALWLDTVNRECAKAREMFQLSEFSAEWRIKPDVNNVDSGASVLGS